LSAVECALIMKLIHYKCRLQKVIYYLVKMKLIIDKYFLSKYMIIIIDSITICSSSLN